MRGNKISDAVVKRLPKYFRYLSEIEAAGIERVSSSRMSVDMGLNASQIRRDLNCFGGFGQQGYGYQVKRLRREIMNILGIGAKYNAIVIGVGNIGQALLKYKSFEQEGYKIIAVFDSDENIIGKKLDGLRVKSMRELGGYIGNNNIDIGIIAAPKRHAQKIADELVQAGVKGIWNFAPTDVQVSRGVSIVNVHLSDSLYVLSYRMRKSDENNKHKHG